MQAIERPVYQVSLTEKENRAFETARASGDGTF